MNDVDDSLKKMRKEKYIYYKVYLFFYFFFIQDYLIFY